MEFKVLIVDDEDQLRRSLTALLKFESYIILEAESGERAIELLHEHEDLAVILCDLKLPGIDGIKVLQQAITIRPYTIRIAMSGYSDSESILQCINDAHVARFIMKPFKSEVLYDALEEATKSFWMKKENERLELITAQQKVEMEKLSAELEKKVSARTRELQSISDSLENTLDGVVRLLVNVLGVYSGDLRGHSVRVAEMATRLAESAKCSPKEISQIRMAAFLHDIGRISMPYTVSAKPIDSMTEKERQQFQEHPLVGFELLRTVPGFETVATLVRHHHEAMSGKGYPDGLKREEIPLGARIIAIVDNFDRYRYPHGKSVIGSPFDAKNKLQMAASSRLDARLVDLFLKTDIPHFTHDGSHEVEVLYDCLKPGMKLSRDIVNSLGKSLVREGTVLTDELIAQLLQNPSFDRVLSRIHVLESSVPTKDTEDVKTKTSAVPHTEEIRPLVIVVDDEVHVVNALKRELRRAGYDVEGFTQPLDAYQHLRIESEVLALITDYDMPGIRGDRFLHQVQKEFPDLPCLVITGKANRDTVIRIRQVAHLTRILPKPWDRGVLLETLDSLKSKPSSETSSI